MVEFIGQAERDEALLRASGYGSTLGARADAARAGKRRPHRRIRAGEVPSTTEAVDGGGSLLCRTTGWCAAGPRLEAPAWPCGFSAVNPVGRMERGIEASPSVGGRMERHRGNAGGEG